FEANNITVRVRAGDVSLDLNLHMARRKMLNIMSGLRPYVLEIPPDEGLKFWSLGYINGRNNSRWYVSEMDTEFNIHHLLNAPLTQGWKGEQWQDDIVKGIEEFAAEWRDFFKSVLEEEPSPAIPSQEMPPDPVTLEQMWTAG